MDVTKNRDINKIIILGSGTSIIKLTFHEIEYINRCKIVIALNKFMAFYKKSGIIPTHIYFHDLYGFNIFKYMLDVCKRDKLENLTLFTSSYYNMVTYSKKYDIPVCIIKDILFYRIKSLLIILIRLGRNSDIHIFKLRRKFQYFLLPKGMKVHHFSISTWNKGGKWAKSLKEKIYHYRGSLTSAINIASIIGPGQDILLVGNDFYGDSYFYENELEILNLDWKDDTYEKVKTSGMHFSFQNINGTKMEDKMPYIIQKLKNSNNNLYCSNPESLLVKDAGVNYKPIIDNLV